MPDFQIINGDALQSIQAMPDGSVDCIVTSPPYWGLRDYGHAGQMGLEVSPEAYVQGMVEVFREARRVLAPQGTLWLNLGDCYATGAGKVGNCPGGGAQGEAWKKGNRGDRPGSPKHSTGAMGPMTQPNRLPIQGLKPKDLIGVPWRVAFALQADGWYLRSDIIWAKPNPMPESVTDRPTKAHEYLFLLSKSERYFYDADAVKEDAVGESLHDLTGAGYAAPGQAPNSGNRKALRNQIESRHRSQIKGGQSLQAFPDGKRNRRSVWTIASEPFKDAHFAVMPRALVAPCILAGCPEGGTVLDPFAGSGTVGTVALNHGRRFIGIELNPAYAAMAHRRISASVPGPNLFTA